MAMDPHLLDLLRAACQRSSQSAVARRLRDASGNGYPSDTVISQALSGKYPGRLDRLEALVAGLYGGAKVACPVLGEIGRDQCDRHQHAPFAATNPIRVALYRACRGCPNAEGLS